MSVHRHPHSQEKTMSNPKQTLSRLALALGLATGLLAGCESTKLTEPGSVAPVESRTPGATAPGAPTTAKSAAQSSVNTVDAPNIGAAVAAGGEPAPMNAPGQRVVYFDFDSFAIRDEFKPVVEGHARVLTKARTKKLVIEGHTDERGGREYNLALGQKRAESVAKSLELLGVSGGQIEAVSFGKERPAVQGADESAWARNRRAELKDR
jgi:peptidoglycan-associated lipoprotein